MVVDLGTLGKRPVARAPREAGHWLWLNRFGWHDCSPAEDVRCKAAAQEDEGS